MLAATGGEVGFRKQAGAGAAYDWPGGGYLVDLISTIAAGDPCLGAWEMREGKSKYQSQVQRSTLLERQLSSGMVAPAAETNARHGHGAHVCGLWLARRPSVDGGSAAVHAGARAGSKQALGVQP